MLLTIEKETQYPYGIKRLN
uniref:Uncharacterized protein n=1 Tax=Arundo donax TaxID=35708 RepID=A0A0A9CH27_ARUDO